MVDPVTQYLASRGMAPSADNANRVRAAYASNPDLLDRRAMGLSGGLDDNSASIDAALNAVLEKSMPTAAIPQGSVEVDQPGKIPPPSRTGASVKGPGEVGGTKAGVASRQGNYGPGASPSRQGEYGNAEAAAPTGVTGDLTGSSYASGSQIGPTQRITPDITGWLLGLLGAGSMGALGYGINRQARKAREAGEGVSGPLPGTVPPDGSNARDISNQVQVDTTDPATMRARMEAEVAAENDAMQRQMEQEALARKRQQGTQETLDAARARQREFGQAAKRATGRR